jgi:histone demethylase JARID1
VAVVTYQPSELCFLEIPTIQLSEEFLRDPYRLIDDLYAKQYDKVGIVKLVAPALSKNIWKTLRDRLKEKRLVTRR